VLHMPRKTDAPRSVQFSITLPVRATEMMMRLAGTGFFSTSRGEIARGLILAHLRQLGAPAIGEALRKTTGKKNKKKKKSK
jgi:hypothetical protein